MNTEQERAEFEAWYASRHETYDTTFIYYTPENRYQRPSVDESWSAYQAGRAALQSQPRTEPSEWLKQHEALMHRVSKAAMVVGYGGTINGATAEQSLEHAEKTLLDHARSLQSQDAEDAERFRKIMNMTRAERGGVLFFACDRDVLNAVDHARRVEGES